MLYKQLVFIIICLFCASCFSCSRAQDINEDLAFSGDTDTGSDSDSDSDSGSDTDTDTDTDFEIDTDTGLEIDTDTGTDCTGKGNFTLCNIVTTPDRSYDICINELCKSPGCGTVNCNAPGPNFTLPDTNQRKCYNDLAEMVCPVSGEDWYGQDAQYGWDTNHPATERYSRDSTLVTDEYIVIDNVTDLEWQGCQIGKKGAECTITDTAIATKIKWQAALAHCDSLDWGGYSDWRLPNEFELESIVDLGRIIPSIDIIAFSGEPKGGFKSSSSYLSSINSYNVWTVTFSEGHVVFIHKSNATNHGRCVRGDSSIVDNRFTRDTLEIDNPVVIDNATDLVWQGCANGMTGDNCENGRVTRLSWKAALSYCEELDWAKKTDWYLPNTIELRSIIDNSIQAPSIDEKAFFSGEAIGRFWSSSTYAGNTAEAWYADIEIGLSGYSSKENKDYIRCVRRKLQ